MFFCLLEHYSKIKDATPAMFIVIVLFMIPANWRCLKFCRSNPGSEGASMSRDFIIKTFILILNSLPGRLPTEATPGLITWKFINQKVPWSLIFLLGGGFALAEGGRVSGMSALLGQSLAGLKTLPPLLLLFVVCLTAQTLTEFTSNVAICNVILPVLAEMVRMRRLIPNASITSNCFTNPSYRRLRSKFTPCI